MIDPRQHPCHKQRCARNDTRTHWQTGRQTCIGKVSGRKADREIDKNTHSVTRSLTHTHTHTHTHTQNIHARTHTHDRKHTHKHTHARTHARTHAHTHTHTHTHTLTHTHRACIHTHTKVQKYRIKIVWSHIVLMCTLLVILSFDAGKPPCVLAVKCVGSANQLSVPEHSTPRDSARREQVIGLTTKAQR